MRLYIGIPILWALFSSILPHLYMQLYIGPIAIWRRSLDPFIQLNKEKRYYASFYEYLIPGG